MTNSQVIAIFTNILQLVVLIWFIWKINKVVNKILSSISNNITILLAKQSFLEGIVEMLKIKFYRDEKEIEDVKKILDEGKKVKNDRG